jgi:hypothetical protein
MSEYERMAMMKRRSVATREYNYEEARMEWLAEMHQAEMRASPRGEEQQRLGQRVSPRGARMSPRIHTSPRVKHMSPRVHVSSRAQDIPPPPGMSVQDMGSAALGHGGSPAPTPTANSQDALPAFPGSTINREKQEARARDRHVAPPAATTNGGDSPDTIRRDSAGANAGH